MASRGKCRECQKRTSARDDRGFVCVACNSLADQRGGDRKSMRFKGAAATSSSSEESGADSEVPEPTKCGSISFVDEKYTKCAEFIGGPGVDALCEEVDRAVGVRDMQLWRSFLYFWVLMLLQQPEALVPEDTKNRIAVWVAEALRRHIVQHVPLLGKVPPGAGRGSEKPA